MTQPAWLAGALAAVMIATAVYCTSRLAARPARRCGQGRDVDLVHATMGVSMGGMLVTRLNPLPNVVWAVLFGLATVWFGAQIWRRADPRHVPHLVMSGAMVYMLLAATVAPAVIKHGPMAMTGARFPLIALVLALAMIGCVVWQAERLSAPRLAAGCQIAMSLTMGYMLIMLV
jgi:Domain of unknown function (DUF5134)